MSGQATCPQCGTIVESDWAWCHECGFDPEGNRPPEPAAPSFTTAPAGAAHPYADLPYSAEPAPPADFGPGPSGLTPAGPVHDAFGPTGGRPPTSPPPGAQRPAPGPSFGGPSPQGPGGYGRPPGGPGFVPAPGGPGFAPAPSASNTGRTVLVVLIAVLVVAVIGVGLVKVSSDSSSTAAKPTTTRDPNAPPPIGAVLGNASSTLPGAPTTRPAPTSIPEPTDGWITYHAPDGTFQVEYPGKPRVESEYFAAPGQQLDALNVIYEVGVDGGGYSVVYLSLPSAAYYADARAAFADINEFNKTRGRPVFNDAGDFTVDGNPAVRFTGEYHGRPEQGAVVVKGLRLYEIDVLDVDDASFNRFLASFHILKDPVR